MYLPTHSNDPSNVNPSDVGDHPYTILRIKRKRNEEPLEGLVIESRGRRKRSRGGLGLFQFAQTVESNDWDDKHKQKDIEEKISRLAYETPFLDNKAFVQSNEEKSISPTRALKDEAARRYTIIGHQDYLAPLNRPPHSLPELPSSKSDKEKVSPDFRMYDAIPFEEQQAVSEEQISGMDNFMPMLTAYLESHNINSLSNPSIQSSDSKAVDSTLPTSDTDYVWDLFYHRPATLSEWNEVANIGTLTGLPSWFGDGYDSASGSEEEIDEADEDSNAEEYYKNDYPEEENSDEFHESSDYEDIMNDRDDFRDINTS